MLKLAMRVVTTSLRSFSVKSAGGDGDEATAPSSRFEKRGLTHGLAFLLTRREEEVGLHPPLFYS